jgi:RNA polymerase sigma factor (sigma-70 family)
MDTQRDNQPDEVSAKSFVTTQWTVVLAAGHGHASQARRALEELCRLYWYPLYAYARRQGYSNEDAEDLTQGLFARLLGAERNCFKELSSEKGRFRAFLLAAFKHFMANEWDHAHRQKRGGGVPALPLDFQGADDRYQIEPADQLSPDKLYDRAWAVALLEQVISRLREEARAEGKAELFELVKPFLMAGSASIPYAEATTQVGISEGTLRVTVHRLRKRYRQLLREEISETLAEPGNADEELVALFSAFQA